MHMITVLVDDMTAASAYSLLLPEGPKSRDRNSKELTFLLIDGGLYCDTALRNARV